MDKGKAVMAMRVSFCKRLTGYTSDKVASRTR